MKTSVKLVILGAALGISWAGIGTGWAQDAAAVLAKRQDTMKAQSKAMAAIKAFNEGKGDLAAAQAGGAGFCSKCGAQRASGDRFCSKCGAPLK